MCVPFHQLRKLQILAKSSTMLLYLKDRIITDELQTKQVFFHHQPSLQRVPEVCHRHCAHSHSYPSTETDDHTLYPVFRDTHFTHSHISSYGSYIEYIPFNNFDLSEYSQTQSNTLANSQSFSFIQHFPFCSERHWKL